MKETLRNGLIGLAVLGAAAAWGGELTQVFELAPEDVSLTQAGPYTAISFPESSVVRDTVGAPSIPARFANILLPSGAENVTVEGSGALEILAEGIVPYPVQRTAPKSRPMPAFTEADAGLYGSAAERPATAATFEGLHAMQGYTFVSVRVNPLVYVGAEQRLYLRRSVAVKVTYDEPAAPVARTRSARQAELGSEMVNSLVVNPMGAKAVRAARAGAKAAAVDYLIITSSTLSNAFQQLATYRGTATGGGYTTRVVTTNTIASEYTGTDIQAKIRACISNYVKTAGTTYVVLGGDDKAVPDRDCYAYTEGTYEYHMPTDLYYSDLTGSWKASGNTNYGVTAASVDMSPDVIVGRIPVRTAAQLEAYLAKVQAYESGNHPTNKIIMGGPAAWGRYYGNKRPSDNVTGDGHAAFRSTNPAHTYVSDSEMWLRRLYRDGISPYWSAQVGIACDSLTSWDSSTCGDRSLSSTNLKGWLNQNWTHLMFSGHGYPQGWGMETTDNFTQSTASSMTGLVAFVYTDACLTGAFDEDGVASSGITTDAGTSDAYHYTSEPCLGEGFIRNANGGALAHMGCARYGWGEPDYQNSDADQTDRDGYYTNWTASATSDGGPSTVYAYKFYKRLYESAALSSNRTLGAAFAMHKADMISQCRSDGSERWIQFGMNLLGDPALTIAKRAMEPEAPAFSSATATEGTVERETMTFSFAALLTAGYPAPTWTISTSVPGSEYDFADGILEYTPSAPGTSVFTCTAQNASGSASCTLTLTVTGTPPAVPENVRASSTNATGFTAAWDAAAGATSYRLDVLTTSSGGGTPTDVIDESFQSWTSHGSYGSYEEEGSGGTWSMTQAIVAPGAASSGDGSAGRVQLKSAAGYLTLPAVDGPTTVTVIAGASSSDGELSLQKSLDGGTTWVDVTSWTDMGTAVEVYEEDVDEESNGVLLRLYASYRAMYIHDITVTAGGGMSFTGYVAGYSNKTVSGTSQAVTGLTPGTTYGFRVRSVNSYGTSADSSVATVTTVAADSAPVWAALPAQAVNAGEILEFAPGTYASGSPAPAVTLTASTAASADYAFSNGELLFQPTAGGTYTFTFLASNTMGTASATLTVTVTAAAPTFTSGTSVAGTAGEMIEFTATATGIPEPVVTLTASTANASEYVADGGYVVFQPTAAGTYTFTFRAENTAGSASQTVTATVGAAPVTVPELTLSGATESGFTASWTACNGVAGYLLQVATDDQFTSGGSGATSVIFSNAATSTTAPAGWTYDINSASASYLVLGASTESVLAPAFNASGFTSMTLTLQMRKYGGPTGSATNVTVSASTDGGTTWTVVGVDGANSTTMTTKTFDLTSLCGRSNVLLKFTDPGAAGGKGVGIKGIVLEGTEAAGTGSLVYNDYVYATSQALTGLEADTLYYARVKGTSEWSTVKSIRTTAEPGPEPGPVPASDYEAWVEAQTGETAHEYPQAAEGANGQPNWVNYVCDISPEDTAVLEAKPLEVSAAGSVEVKLEAASADRYYQLISSSDLTGATVTNNLGWGAPGMVITNAMTGTEWFGTIRVLLSAP